MKDLNNVYGMFITEKQLKLAKITHRLARARQLKKPLVIFSFWLSLGFYIIFCSALSVLWSDTGWAIGILIIISTLLYILIETFKMRKLLNQYGPGNKDEITTLDTEN